MIVQEWIHEKGDRYHVTGVAQGHLRSPARAAPHPRRGVAMRPRSQSLVLALASIMAMRGGMAASAIVDPVLPPLPQAAKILKT